MLDTTFSAEDPMDAQSNTYASQPGYSVDGELGAQDVQNASAETVVAAEMNNAGSADGTTGANGTDMAQPAGVGSGHTTLQLQDGELASDRVADLVGISFVVLLPIKMLLHLMSPIRTAEHLSKFRVLPTTLVALLDAKGAPLRLFVHLPARLVLVLTQP